MDVTDSGFPYPEGIDAAVAATCRDMAEAAEDRLMEMLSGLDLAANPQCVELIPSVARAYGPDSDWVALSYDTTLSYTCDADPGSGGGISLYQSGLEPGIWLVGATMAWSGIGAGVSRLLNRVVVADPAGPKYTENTYTYSTHESGGANPSTGDMQSPVMLVRIVSPRATIRAQGFVIGGAANLQTYSRLWAARLGDVNA